MAVPSRTRIGKVKPVKRRAPQDATLRNVRASKKRMTKLEARIVSLMKELKALRDSIMDKKR